MEFKDFLDNFFLIKKCDVIGNRVLIRVCPRCNAVYNGKEWVAYDSLRPTLKKYRREWLQVNSLCDACY